MACRIMVVDIQSGLYSALLANMDPPQAVSVFKLGMQVVVSVCFFFSSAVKILKE